MEVGKERIVQAIQAAESRTSGEIRVHLSNAKNEEDILAAAKASFGALEMHRTKDRNGILLYFNPTLRRFAIYGDEGIHQRVGQGFWEELSRSVSSAIRNEDLTAGIAQAVKVLGQALETHFPRESSDRNELTDEISETPRS